MKKTTIHPNSEPPPVDSLRDQKSTLWSSTANHAKTTPLVTDSWVEGARPDVVRDQISTFWSSSTANDALKITKDDSELVTDFCVEGARPDVSR